MANLILKSDIFPSGQIQIEDWELPRSVGRSHRADITIPDLLLSRVHAEFRLSPAGRFQIVDNDSTNLTIVNDQDVESAELKSGDRILLGDTEIIVEIEHSRPDPNENTTRELPVVRARRNLPSD